MFDLKKIHLGIGVVFIFLLFTFLWVQPIRAATYCLKFDQFNASKVECVKYSIYSDKNCEYNPDGDKFIYVEAYNTEEECNKNKQEIIEGGFCKRVTSEKNLECVSKVTDATMPDKEKYCVPDSKNLYKLVFFDNYPECRNKIVDYNSIKNSIATAAETETKANIQLKPPILSITLPTLPNFTDAANTLDEENNITLPWIGEYIAAMYKFALVIISIVAVIMIIFTGGKMVIGGGEVRVEGFKRIGQTIVGLFIAWASYAVLSIINPGLVNFKTLRIKYIQEIPLSEEQKEAAGAAKVDLASCKPSPPKASAPVPKLESCAATCKRSAKQMKIMQNDWRDWAFKAQQSSGYPAAVLLFMRMMEGPAFGIMASGKLVPSEKLSSADEINKLMSCPANSDAIYTKECLKPGKYKPVAKEDKNADGSPKNCKDSTKILIHGYRCLSKNPFPDQPFQMLLNYFDKARKGCFKNAKDKYGGDPKCFLLAVQACGYFTATKYVQIGNSTMDRCCLYDKKNTASFAPASATADDKTADTLEADIDKTSE